MDRAEVTATLAVSVAYSPAAGVVDVVDVRVAPGATLLDALNASGLLVRHPEIDPRVQAFGIWGQRRAVDAPLRDGDRVEVYRPLLIDPKDARRLRQRRQQATCSPRR
jgi:hypothetical protein